MLERIPAKGAILGFAVLAASLSLTARLADRGVRTAARLGQAAQGRTPGASADSMSPELQAALPPAFAAALAGEVPGDVPGDAEGVGLGGLGLGPGVGLGLGLGQDPAEANGDEEKSSRPPGYVYPKFDPPGPSGHGVAAGAVPRNIGMRFVDEEGEPLTPDSVRGTQSGDDGRFDLRGYRSSETLQWWTVGSPALTAGSRARLTLQVTIAGEPWVGNVQLDSVPREVNLDLTTPVELVRLR